MFTQLIEKVKNSALVTYNHPLAYCQHSIASIAKNTLTSTSILMVKSVIYLTRFAYDVASDISQVALNTITAQAVTLEAVTSPSNTSYFCNQNDSWVQKSKNFVVQTWHDKDNSYTGKVSKALGNANCPLAKLTSDSACLLYNTAKATVEAAVEIAKIPVQAVWDGVAGAYLAEEAAQNSCLLDSSPASSLLGLNLEVISDEAAG